MLKNVVCATCKRPFTTQKAAAKISKVFEKKGRPDLQKALSLCPDCRREAFVRQLVGDDLAKVTVKGHIPKRRKERLEPVKLDPKTGATVLKSSCFSCNHGCDVSVHVKDGKVVKVEGDASSPTTRGILCAKGLASRSLVYHPERLRRPLMRAGERGAGRWKEISWDEALETIVDRLRAVEERYGKDSVLLATGTSRGWAPYFNRFANAFHRQLVGPGYAQCLWPRLTSQMLLGIAPALECPDILLHPEKTKCMLVWGTNPPNTSPIKASWMMDAQALGARMIVVDPMLSEMASKADLWLQLRPGTDAALALGMLNVIIREDLYDRGFVDRWCNGFEQLRERAAEYPPNRVAEITWVPEEKILEAARMYATRKPASLIQCLATEQVPDTISACMALGMLAAITGNIDVPGGNMLPMPRDVIPDIAMKEVLTKEDHEKRLGREAYPLLAGEDSWAPTAHAPTTWRAVLTGKPYPVRALYCQGSNPALSYANSPLVVRALRSMDFIAVADFFMTPTADLADIVLPVATWLERTSIQTFFQVTYDDIHLQQKALEIEECWSDYRILNELSKKLGFGELMFDSEEALCDMMLAPSGMTLEAFRKVGRVTVPYAYRKYEKTGFGHPGFRNLHASEKVEIYSHKIEALGFDPLPKHKEPTESPVSTPELAKEYPLILTTGRKEAVYRHTELRNIPLLREIVPEFLVHVHPDTAMKLGIEQGASIVVESPRGGVEGTAYLTRGIDPRVVLVPAQWPGKHNANDLLHDEDTAPMIGSAQLRCQLCRIRRAQD